MSHRAQIGRLALAAMWAGWGALTGCSSPSEGEDAAAATSAPAGSSDVANVTGSLALDLENELKSEGLSQAEAQHVVDQASLTQDSATTVSEAATGFTGGAVGALAIVDESSGAFLTHADPRKDRALGAIYRVVFKGLGKGFLKKTSLEDMHVLTEQLVEKGTAQLGAAGYAKGPVARAVGKIAGNAVANLDDFGFPLLDIKAGLNEVTTGVLDERGSLDVDSTDLPSVYGQLTEQSVAAIGSTGYPPQDASDLAASYTKTSVTKVATQDLSGDVAIDVFSAMAAGSTASLDEAGVPTEELLLAVDDIAIGVTEVAAPLPLLASKKDSLVSRLAEQMTIGVQKLGLARDKVNTGLGFVSKGILEGLGNAGLSQSEIDDLKDDITTGLEEGLADGSDVDIDELIEDAEETEEELEGPDDSEDSFFVDGYPWLSTAADTTADLVLKSDRDVTAHWVVAIDAPGMPVPSASQILAGKDGLNLPAMASGMSVLAANTLFPLTVTALTSMTPYRFFVVLQDSGTSAYAAVTKDVPFTTTGGPPSGSAPVLVDDFIRVEDVNPSTARVVFMAPTDDEPIGDLSYYVAASRAADIGGVAGMARNSEGPFMWQGSTANTFISLPSLPVPALGLRNYVNVLALDQTNESVTYFQKSFFHSSAYRGYWPFDGILNDATNGANPVTLGFSGFPGALDRFLDGDGALALDGVDDGVDTLVTSLAAPFTVAAWVRVNTLAPAVQPVVFKHVMAGGGPEYQTDFELSVLSGGLARFRMGNGATFGVQITTAGPAIAAGEWHHLMAIYHDSDPKNGLRTGRFYVDGELIGGNSTNWTGGPRQVGGGPIFLGHANLGPPQYLQGAVDEVILVEEDIAPWNATDMVYDPKRTGSLAADLNRGLIAFFDIDNGPQNPAGANPLGPLADFNGSGTSAFAPSGVTYVSDVRGRSQSAASLDDTSGQFITLPITSMPLDFTLSFWVHFDSGTLATSQLLAAKHASDGAPITDAELVLRTVPASGSLELVMGQGAGSSYIAPTGPNLVDGMWNFVAVSLSGSTGQGRLMVARPGIVTDTPVSFPGPRQSGPEDLKFGRFFDGATSHCSCSVDRIRVYNRVMTRSEMRTIFEMDDSLPP